MERHVIHEIPVPLGSHIRQLVFSWCSGGCVKVSPRVMMAGPSRDFFLGPQFRFHSRKPVDFPRRIWARSSPVDLQPFHGSLAVLHLKHWPGITYHSRWPASVQDHSDGFRIFGITFTNISLQHYNSWNLMVLYLSFSFAAVKILSFWKGEWKDKMK